MVWVRLDDHFDEHPKIQEVGPLGIALFTAGLAYCNRNLTDGFIPWSAARSLVSWEFLEPKNKDGKQRIATVAITSGMSGDDVTSEYVISLLKSAGLWKEVPGGFKIHDYLDFQPSKQEVLKERENTRIRQQRFRTSHSNAVSNTVSNGAVTDAPVPVPVPEEQKLKRQLPCPADAGRNGNEAREVLNWLNQKAGRNFRACEANLKLIRDRLKDGISEHQLKAIVSRKVKQWKGTEQDLYLRPLTLFAKTKCEQYIGELPKAVDDGNTLPGM